jgi:HK97 family phage major capsid protein
VNTSIEQLTDQKAALVECARALLAAAEKEGRELTAAEGRQQDALVGAIESLNAELECRRSAGVRRVPPARSPEVDEMYPREQDSPALTNEQRCADVVKRSLVFTDYERDSYSLGRIIRSMVTGDRRGLSDLEKRAMSEGTDSAGGYTVFDELGTHVIDRVRNSMRVIQAGALTVPMQSDTLNLARLATGATTAWKTENAAITAGDLSFERVQLVAKTLPVLVKMSVELFEDMSPGAEKVIEREIAQAIALELDRVALRGSGTGAEPRGIINQTGVTLQSSGANGTTPADYDFLVDAIASVWSANGQPNARIYASRTAKTLAKLKDSQNQPLRAPDAVLNVKELITNQIPTSLTVGTSDDCSEAYVGDFRELLIGMRTAFRLEASRHSGDAFSNLQVWIRAYIRADVALAHPALFTVVQGIRA